VKIAKKERKKKMAFVFRALKDFIKQILKINVKNARLSQKALQKK